MCYVLFIYFKRFLNFFINYVFNFDFLKLIKILNILKSNSITLFLIDGNGETNLSSLSIISPIHKDLKKNLKENKCQYEFF